MGKAITQVKDFTALGAALPTTLQVHPDVWLTRFRNLRILQSLLSFVTILVWAFSWLLGLKHLYATESANTLKHPPASTTVGIPFGPGIANRHSDAIARFNNCAAFLIDPEYHSSMADLNHKHGIFFALALTACSIGFAVGIAGAILHEKLPFRKVIAWGLVASDVALITGLSTIYYFSTAFYADSLSTFDQGLCGVEASLVMLGSFTFLAMLVTMVGAILPAPPATDDANSGGDGDGGGGKSKRKIPDDKLSEAVVEVQDTVNQLLMRGGGQNGTPMMPMMMMAPPPTVPRKPLGMS